MNRAVLSSIASYAPERVITNQYFNEVLGEDVDTWLRENVNIHQRHWCNENESTSTLCIEAAKKALAQANITANDLQLIIVATDTPDFVSPSTASIVQHQLGAINAGTFDVNTACAGFVTALDIASKYIMADSTYKHILVIGAYAMSKYLNQHDKKTVTLFADGAGAVVLSAQKSTQNPPQGFLASELSTKGEYNEWMGIYGGGTRNPINQNTLQAGLHQLQFVKKFPKELNPEQWSAIIKRLCARIDITPQDVTHYFITQININSIRETMNILGVEQEKAWTVMDEYGYTGSACIPMAFDKAMKSGSIRSGDILMFVGSGGGLAFAGAAFRM